MASKYWPNSRKQRQLIHAGIPHSHKEFCPFELYAEIAIRPETIHFPEWYSFAAPSRTQNEKHTLIVFACQQSALCISICQVFLSIYFSIYITFVYSDGTWVYLC